MSFARHSNLACAGCWTTDVYNCRGLRYPNSLPGLPLPEKPGSRKVRKDDQNCSVSLDEAASVIASQGLEKLDQLSLLAFGQ
jgi:hypothetical protein